MCKISLLSLMCTSILYARILGEPHLFFLPSQSLLLESQMLLLAGFMLLLEDVTLLLEDLAARFERLRLILQETALLLEGLLYTLFLEGWIILQVLLQHLLDLCRA